MGGKRILTVIIQRIAGAGAEGETDKTMAALHQAVGKPVYLAGDAVGPVGRQFLAEERDPDRTPPFISNNKECAETHISIHKRRAKDNGRQGVCDAFPYPLNHGGRCAAAAPRRQY